jgi:hypothetical protein
MDLSMESLERKAKKKLGVEGGPFSPYKMLRFHDQKATEVKNQKL